MQIPIKRYLIRLYLGALAFFVVNKFVIRALTADAAVPGWLEVVTLSSPNLVEAIVGTTNVAVLLLLARRHLGQRWAAVSDSAVYTTAALLAATFVLTQEFKLHDLGGRNVYDPLDAVASGIGVVAMWLLFHRYGVLKDHPAGRVPRDG